MPTAKDNVDIFTCKILYVRFYEQEKKRYNIIFMLLYATDEQHIVSFNSLADCRKCEASRRHVCVIVSECMFTCVCVCDSEIKECLISCKSLWRKAPAKWLNVNVCWFLIKRMPCSGRHLTSLSFNVWTHLIAHTQATAAEDLDPVWAQSAPAKDRSHSHFFPCSAITLERQQLLTQIRSQYSDVPQLFLGYMLQDRKGIHCIYWHSGWDMLSGVKVQASRDFDCIQIYILSIPNSMLRIRIIAS